MGKDTERNGLGQAGRDTGKESAERRERDRRDSKGRERKREKVEGRELQRAEKKKKKTQKNIDTEGHEDEKTGGRKIQEPPCWREMDPQGAGHLDAGPLPHWPGQPPSFLPPPYRASLPQPRQVEGAENTEVFRIFSMPPGPGRGASLLAARLPHWGERKELSLFFGASFFLISCIYIYL